MSRLWLQLKVMLLTNDKFSVRFILNLIKTEKWPEHLEEKGEFRSLTTPAAGGWKVERDSGCPEQNKDDGCLWWVINAAESRRVFSDCVCHSITQTLSHMTSAYPPLINTHRRSLSEQFHELLWIRPCSNCAVFVPLFVFLEDLLVPWQLLVFQIPDKL